MASIFDRSTERTKLFATASDPRACRVEPRAYVYQSCVCRSVCRYRSALTVRDPRLQLEIRALVMATNVGSHYTHHYREGGRGERERQRERESGGERERQREAGDRTQMWSDLCHSLCAARPDDGWTDGRYDSD